jgi:hypothetical protein
MRPGPAQTKALVLRQGDSRNLESQSGCVFRDMQVFRISTFNGKGCYGLNE